ncbi:MAG: hypothetical protein RL300_1010 [Pseudomonadota bacterium]|jgi:hypothetical protein
MSADLKAPRAEVLSVLNAYHSAMVSASTDILNGLLCPDFMLVHITGYKQPKAEWLDVVRSGAFDYHRIELDESSLALDVSASAATLNGRGVFHATINDMKNPWRLQFNIKMAKHHASWRLVQARYTSF